MQFTTALGMRARLSIWKTNNRAPPHDQVHILMSNLEV